MAISAKCATAIRAAAAGRKISDERMALIEDAISEQMRQLARESRAESRAKGQPDRWRGLTKDQRVAEASARAMEIVQADAALKEARGVQQMLANATTEQRVMGFKTGNRTRSQASVAEMQATANEQAAIRNEYVSGLGDIIDAVESRDGTGLFRNLGMRLFNLDNPAMTADIVREIFRNADGHTGNAAAKAAAQAWLSTIEAMRTRFNNAGGNIRKLGYGYMSQAHDAVRVAAINAVEWAQKVLPLLDREQYVKPDGALMNEAELLGMLEAAHKTISEGGANKREVGGFKGSGARANRGADHRVLHFADGDAWMAYMKEFGQGSLYDSMLGHIGRMSDDIGLVERYGPNPEQTHRVQLDLAQREDKPGTAKTFLANRSFMNQPEAYWRLISGKATTPEDRFLALIGSGVRNLQTAAKLGGAVLSSFTDVGTIALSLHYNRLPYFEMVRNVGKRLKPGSEEAHWLRSHEVIAEGLISTLNRFTGDHMTHSLTGRVASSVMHLSLMNAWTDGLRGAFAATMMQGFSKKLGKAWGALDAWDRNLMTQKGLTEADWNIISQAQPTMRGDLAYLTGDAIRSTGIAGAEQAANKWMGFVTDEGQFAVVNPDLATRAIATGGGMAAGTIPGEAIRAFWQFKSFPMAMMSRHWRRIFQTEQGLEGAPMGFGAQTAAGGVVNKVGMFAALNVTGMLLGAIVLQNKALLAGKDPYQVLDDDNEWGVPLPEEKFWVRALAQGGGMGYAGDVLLSDPSGDMRNKPFETVLGIVAGPSGGAVGGLADLLITNPKQAASGKDPKAAAEALRWANSQLPYVGLWQVRSIWEHNFLHNAQEALNPGYLSRLQQRTAKEWSGQGYYWTPGESVPDRAPNWSNVTGE